MEQAQGRGQQGETWRQFRACQIGIRRSPRHLSIQDRYVAGEERWQTLGLVSGVLVLLVAHTYQEQSSEEVIRIISARRATPKERKRYEQDI